MKKYIFSSIMTALLFTSLNAFAEQLPSLNPTTTLTAYVSEQAIVSMPTSAAFQVTGESGPEAKVTASLHDVVQSSEPLKIAVKSSSENFTLGDGKFSHFKADDVEWNAAEGRDLKGISGILSTSSFSEIASIEVDAKGRSINEFIFRLPQVSSRTSGNHTLQIVWKIECLGEE
ncbi:MAG: hypothetical protein KY468_12345 [Armatimonadetes bacterium]|nr:hypothetical protein [Armatimonadota bacterium]